MLAILFIKMRWYKNDRNPEGTTIRKKYYEPRIIEELSHKLHREETVNPFSVFIYKIDCVQNSVEVKEAISTKWCDVTSIEGNGISNIEVVPEENGYRVMWFDSGNGNVRRRGGNEDFRKKGRKLSGVPNVLNETAFILEDNDSGKISWNNRFSSYHGQWYEQYQLYIVNSKILETVLLSDKKKKVERNHTSIDNLFMRDYDYEYYQMADLF